MAAPSSRVRTSPHSIGVAAGKSEEVADLQQAGCGDDIVQDVMVTEAYKPMVPRIPATAHSTISTLYKGGRTGLALDPTVFEWSATKSSIQHSAGKTRTPEEGHRSNGEQEQLHAQVSGINLHQRHHHLLDWTTTTRLQQACYLRWIALTVDRCPEAHLQASCEQRGAQPQV
jgi:hypothetical protein